MAEMIPESMPSGRPQGEEFVFDVLKKLPDEYFVYYEPRVGDRYPDFIVICPDLGVLVIEVKDWSVKKIADANDDSVTIRDGDNLKKHNNPVRQARDYMFRLMDTCRRHPEFTELCHLSGRYEGNPLFPYGYVAFLARIRASELQLSNLIHVFRDSRIVTRDVLDSWRSLDGDKIKKEIKACFRPAWPFTPLTERQVDILRAAIHPDIVVEAQSSERRGEPEAPQKPASEIKILDWNQETYARKIGHGHRVLNGVAGSGKTILLLHRARWLSKEGSEKKILVLCYNRSLSAFLKNELRDCRNVQVSTFHKWGHSLKAKSDKDLERFGQNVLGQIERLQKEDRYDAILIDEAQDWEPSWFCCAVSALKEEEEGDLLIVADGNQGLYRPKSFRWKDVGVHAQGRVIPLRTNYRNTEQIMDLAWLFTKETEDKDDGDTIRCMRPFDAIRRGPAPYIRNADNRDDENQIILELVDGLLRGRWQFTELEKPLEPSEIGILYPRIPHSPFNWRMFFNLKDKLEERCKKDNSAVIWVGDKKDKEAKDKVIEPGLKILTIDSSKGLQYRAVILMWADLLPSRLPDTTTDQDRRKLYVGITRAQDFLAITYSGESEFTKQLELFWGNTFKLS